MEKNMFIITGLGNPGRKFEKTRHNMGFAAVDIIGENYGIKINRLKHKALVGDGLISGRKVLLVKPQTYMNLSGESLAEIVGYYNVPMENLIVIYDDMDLASGDLRIRKKGSAGSHNGMKSVIYSLGSEEFPRIRIGIGKTDGSRWKSFVTGRPSKEERELLSEAARRAAEGAACIVDKGIDRAMNEYNVRNKSSGKEESD